MKWKKSLPGMDDKVVHWKLHYFALQDVPQGGDDEVIIERIWGRQGEEERWQAVPSLMLSRPFLSLLASEWM